jgi:glycosyltransferase involved in cell wall biosynthesis
MRQLSNFLKANAQLTVLTQFFPPDYAATGQLVEELTRSFCRNNIGVHVFTGQPGYAFDSQVAPKQEIVHGVRVYRSRTSRLWPRRIRGRAIGGVLYCIRSFFKLLHPHYRKALLLVTTEPPYLPVVAYLMHWLFNQPYVCLLYDLYPDVAVTLGVVPESSMIVKFWRWLNRLTWRHAKAIVVLSPTMKQRIVDICPEASGKIEVIHNWADPNLIRPIPKTENWFAHQHGLDQVFTVLYSGNMGRCHDMDTIMAAAIELRHEPVRFVFIGDGAKRRPCVELAQQQQLTNCLFLPYQPKQNLPFSLTACDLSLVSIDRDVEGLVAPSKFYGCLAAGRPIAAICEPHSYLRGMLADGQCGKGF